MHRNNLRYRRNTTNIGFRPPQPPPPQQTPPPIPGQITFKLMCHMFTIGGVIGNSGTVIKLLEQQTLTRIRVDERQPDSVDRLISITGSETISRTITFMRGDEVQMTWDVSAAQEGLIKVLERIFEVEDEKEGETESYGGERSCRLVAVKSLIGVILGKRGENVVRIRNETGARIRVLPQSGFAEALFHITGSLLAVKKAVLIISGYLQDYSPFRNAPTISRNPKTTAPSGEFSDPHAEFFPDLSPLSLNLPEYSADRALSDSVDQISNTDNGDAKREVVFRLLLSLKSAGGVIGKGGSIIRILQNETGASIKSPEAVAGCNDRIFVISAFENPDTSNSSAQNAVVRVFARSIEAAIENRKQSSLNMGEILFARLLIASNQVNCLTESGGDFITELKLLSGAEIQLSGGNCHPSCDSSTDVLVQITGQYWNVQTALLHITGRVRDNSFPNKVLKGVKDRSYPVSAIPNINPNFGFAFTPHLPMAPLRWHQTMTADSRVMTDSGSLQVGSTSISPPAETVTEVVLPENALGSFNGEDGGSLKLIREISGAKVTVVTSHSESEGKVIMSGTPDQIQMAQSLLQAVIGAG